jgi:thiamine pyrophosphate-dependent acetolactate synthase large subunit-like protein
MFKETNFAKVTEGMGCFRIRVEKPDELRSALQRAFSSGKPAVIDAVSDYKVLPPHAWA